jgi:hypothetical protein
MSLRHVSAAVHQCHVDSAYLVLEVAWQETLARRKDCTQHIIAFHSNNVN